MAEFYKQVPKDFQANLRYRLELRKRAATNPDFQQAIMTACRQDVLFFFNALCWLYEPRPKRINGRPLPMMIPFITWTHQDPAILEIKANLGYCDIGVEKSRGEGMSWIAVLLALHDWLFEPMTKISLVSSTEKKADNPNDSDSLFWKIDWELKKLPIWMVGVKDRDYVRNLDGHTLVRTATESTIAAYAATGDVARGGRCKWFLMDELGTFPRGADQKALASVQQVTFSRLLVSTPEGSEGAYYKAMHEPSNMVKIILDWKDNPSRNRGLYQLIGGVPVAVDPVNNPLAPEYDPPTKEVLDLFSRLRRKGFQLEGKPRSPWYDRECDRTGATPKNIAQELDRDYGGSMYRIFGAEFMAAAETRLRRPNITGMFTVHPETFALNFDRDDKGPVLLWTNLDHRGRPPIRQYVVCADVSTGNGGSFTSNSAVHVLDLTTREQVLEYAVNTVEPADFADVCIGIAEWFHSAYLSWEHNGPGTAFTARVKKRKYPFCYMRDVMDKKGRAKTKELGFWTNDRTKEAMFSELSTAVKSGDLVLHSKELVAEFGQYVRINGKIEHITAAKTDDDSSKGQAHGDRVIAIGVGVIASKDRPLSASIAQWNRENPPEGTMAHRQKEYEDSLRESEDDWDDRENSDLALGSRIPRKPW